MIMDFEMLFIIDYIGVSQTKTDWLVFDWPDQWLTLESILNTFRVITSI